MTRGPSSAPSPPSPDEWPCFPSPLASPLLTTIVGRLAPHEHTCARDCSVRISVGGPLPQRLPQQKKQNSTSTGVSSALITHTHTHTHAHTEWLGGGRDRPLESSLHSANDEADFRPGYGDFGSAKVPRAPLCLYRSRDGGIIKKHCTHNNVAQ